MIKSTSNKLSVEDHAVHDWYRFVLAYPPHLVRSYLSKFEMSSGARVLDPFCGTGTTLVECKKLGIESVGVEAHPMTHYASSTKIDWSIDPDLLLADSRRVAEKVASRLESEDLGEDTYYDPESLFGGWSGEETSLRKLPEDSRKLLLKGSISPLPLHKALLLRDCIEEDVTIYSRNERLAFAKALVKSIGNLRFGPEVGVGPPKTDALVISPWLENMETVAADLREVRKSEYADSFVHNADSREILKVLEPESIDAVITSPPYPNEKDYTRTTRLETVMLGLVNNKEELRTLKKTLMRSNTRGVYKGDEDDLWIADHPEIRRIADSIESRRIELGKTSGFERLYARVTLLYFGGMARHLADLRRVLRPGAKMAYVVGDQASYLRVMIRTGQLIADIAEKLGYEVESIDLFRTRLATATGEQLREEVVVLKWTG